MRRGALQTTVDWNLDPFEKISTRQQDGGTPTLGNSEARIVEGQTIREALVPALPDGSTLPNSDLAAESTDGKVPSHVRSAALSTIKEFAIRKELRRAERNTEQLEVLERWDGVVESIDGEKFTARLASTSASPSNGHEAAEFSRKRVAEDDRELLEIGARFTYIVAREMRRGAPQTFSKLTFRRMPFWHLRQVAAAKAEGKLISDYLKANAKPADGTSRPTAFGR